MGVEIALISTTSRLKINDFFHIGVEPHPALLHWPEKESSYLSPNYSFQAAWANQSANGQSKKLYLAKAVMLYASGVPKVQLIYLYIVFFSYWGST